MLDKIKITPLAADGKSFRFGDMELSFSEAVPHGSEDGMLGWVIMASVECGGERFMHAKA